MKIERKKLIEVLSKVQPGLASKEMIEQSQSFVFTDNKVMTYNDEISVCCDFESDLEGAVKAEEFYKLLNKSKAKEVELETSKKELLLKTKSSKAGIKRESKINLPVTEVDRTGKKRELPEGFCEGLKFCLFSASKDMTRPLLTCLLVEENYILSCDNFRITKYNLGKNVKFKKAFLIPAPSAKQLIPYKPSHYAISKSGNWIHFYSEGDVTFSCRTYHKAYPDVQALLEVEGVKVKMPKKLKEILGRAVIFAKGKFDQDSQVSISIKEERLLVKAKGEGGWFKEKTKIEYKGKPVKFAIHPEFFMDSLDLLEKVVIGEKKMKFKTKDFVHVVSLIVEKEEE